MIFNKNSKLQISGSFKHRTRQFISIRTHNYYTTRT